PFWNRWSRWVGPRGAAHLLGTAPAAVAAPAREIRREGREQGLVADGPGIMGAIGSSDGGPRPIGRRPARLSGGRIMRRNTPITAASALAAAMSTTMAVALTLGPATEA